MIDFKFTKKSEEYPEAINALVRRDVGFMSGGEIASYYYKHYVQGLTIRDMRIKSSNYRDIVRTILKANGEYAFNKQLFDYCVLQHKSDLDRLFKVETIVHMKGGLTY